MASGGRIHLLFIIQLVAMGAMEMSGPFWPVHLRSLQLSETVFTLSSIGVYVAPMLGIMLTARFWGRVGDRFGHRAMMMRALAGLALTQGLLAFAQDAGSILALRFLQGACAGFIAPAQAYGIGLVPVERRGRLFAFLQIATNLGSLFGALSGGFMLDHAPFAWINLSAAMLCTLCFAAVGVCLPPVTPSRPSLRPDLSMQGTPTVQWQVAPAIWTILALIGALLLARLATQAPFSLYVLDRFAQGNWATGLCYGLLALGFILSAGFWARHFDARSIAEGLRHLLRIVVCCALVTFAAGMTHSIILFAALYTIWGILLGATTPVLTAMVSRLSSDSGQGQAMGSVQSVSQCASIAGIALGGWFTQEAGIRHLYPLVAGLYLFSLGLVVLARMQAGRKAAPGLCSGASE